MSILHESMDGEKYGLSDTDNFKLKITEIKNIIFTYVMIDYICT